MDADEARNAAQQALNNEHADKELQGLLARLNDKDEPLGRADVYARERLIGHKYLLAGNGPTVWFYMVKDGEAQEEFGVVEYIGSHGSGYSVVPQHQAEVIELALRRDS